MVKDATTHQVPFYRHQLGDDHAQRIASVLAGGHLTYGAVGRRVEDQLRAFFEIENAALTSSWSSGAYAAMTGLGLGTGDEVIVPGMTFVASANIPLLLGCDVKIADVCAATLLLTPETLSKVITHNTKAVMCVHLYGQMCDIPGLRAVCDAHGALLIEDCAHAFEAMRGGVRPGALSDAALFSFYATKNIACGEGGAVITRHAGLHEKITRFRSHGMSASAADRFTRQFYQHWDVAAPGMKGSLPDMLSAVLEPQIDLCLEMLDARAQIGNRYRSDLAGLGLRLPEQLPGARHAQHLFAVSMGDDVAGRCRSDLRDEVIADINAAGVGCTVNYRPLEDLSLFRNHRISAPNARAWGRGTFSLPLYPGMTNAQIDRVINAVGEALNTAFSGAPGRALGPSDARALVLRT